jgi:hypothetical protein
MRDPKVMALSAIGRSTLITGTFTIDEANSTAGPMEEQVNKMKSAPASSAERA